MTFDSRITIGRICSPELIGIADPDELRIILDVIQLSIVSSNRHEDTFDSQVLG